MQVANSVEEIQEIVAGYRKLGKTIGFVPTMGALHEGHLSLIDQCKQVSDVTVVSIFLNPTQFGPNEDLDAYPQSLDADLQACEARQADVVFIPTKETIYPKGFSTYVNEESYATGLCGVSRPLFYRGVATVVTILFNIIRPDLAVFGQKDAQQVAVVKKMVKDLHIPVEIVVGKTVRESDGLAMSSRNKYLDSVQRREAPKIHQALLEGEKLVKQGALIVDRITAEVTHHLSKSRHLRIIYIEIVDKDTMKPEREIHPGQSILVVAVWLDQVRLIDNLVLGE